MSFIPECQPGDKLVCLESFSASPKGVPFSWTTCRTFKIGERVRYVSHYRDEHYKDHPAGWMVVCEAADGNEYAATQIYFVTREAWRNLEGYFTRRVIRQLLTKPFRMIVLKPFRALRKRMAHRRDQPNVPPQSLPPKG
jgi:hypothetical protein